MYDPMVAKLIVWDADREAATARMLRALDEYEIGGLTTLIPFHKALLASKQWQNAETCRDLVEDPKWLKSLAPEEPAAPAAAEGDDEEEKLERDYTVEVDSRRFNVKVIGPPPAGGVAAAGGELHRRDAALRAASAQAERRRRRQRHARLAAAGHGAARERREGPGGRGRRRRVRDRGDEDGERDHRHRWRARCRS